VAEGQSLWSVAKDRLGPDASEDAIRAETDRLRGLNGDLLRGDDTLRPGDDLVTEPAKPAPAWNPPKPPPEVPEEDDAQGRPGEAWSIAASAYRILGLGFEIRDDGERMSVTIRGGGGYGGSASVGTSGDVPQDSSGGVRLKVATPSSDKIAGVDAGGSLQYDARTDGSTRSTANAKVGVGRYGTEVGVVDGTDANGNPVEDATLRDTARIGGPEGSASVDFTWAFDGSLRKLVGDFMERRDEGIDPSIDVEDLPE